MIQIFTHNDQITIAGDGLLLARLPYGFDPSEIDLKDAHIDAQNLMIAADAASYRGIEAVKYYAAMRAKFIEQQELAHIDANKPKEQHEPAITSQSIKAVDA